MTGYHSGGIQRTLGAARSGFAQAFTTGTNTGGYALDAVGIQVSSFPDMSSVGDQLQVTINSAATDGEPGDAHCTLTHPSTFTTPGVISFDAPTGESACPQLVAETTYFVVIEWVSPSGTDAFALIPQTYSTEESAASDEDPGGAQGWSIADDAYYLTVGSDTRTWNAYDETASFKIKVTGTVSEQTTDAETETDTDSEPAPLTVSVTVAAPTTHNGSTAFTFDLEFSEEFGLSYKTLRDHAFNVTGGSVQKVQRTDKPSNISWRITIKPNSTGDVTIELPPTTDCNTTGAICTGDNNKLSNSLSFTVSGPSIGAQRFWSTYRPANLP